MLGSEGRPVYRTHSACNRANPQLDLIHNGYFPVGVQVAYIENCMRLVLSKDSYFSFSFGAMYVTYFGELSESLGFVVDTFYDFGGGTWVVRSNVVMNIVEPRFSLGCPPYFCHDLIRFLIVSFDMTRPFLASKRPLSIMRSNASSRMIST